MCVSHLIVGMTLKTCPDLRLPLFEPLSLTSSAMQTQKTDTKQKHFIDWTGWSCMCGAHFTLVPLQFNNETLLLEVN